jgi:hypothetical protein
MKKVEESSLSTSLGSATRPSNPCMHLCVFVSVHLCHEPCDVVNFIVYVCVCRT